MNQVDRCLGVRQTRRQSLVEAIVTYVVGYTTSVALQVLIFPFFGIVLPIRQNAVIGAIFYGLAIGRAYLLRRVFNRFTRPSGQSQFQSGLESLINNLTIPSVLILVSSATVFKASNRKASGA